MANRLHRAPLFVDQGTLCSLSSSRTVSGGRLPSTLGICWKRHSGGICSYQWRGWGMFAVCLLLSYILKTHLCFFHWKGARSGARGGHEGRFPCPRARVIPDDQDICARGHSLSEKRQHCSSAERSPSGSWSSSPPPGYSERPSPWGTDST